MTCDLCGQPTRFEHIVGCVEGGLAEHCADCQTSRCAPCMAAHAEDAQVDAARDERWQS